MLKQDMIRAFRTKAFGLRLFLSGLLFMQSELIRIWMEV